MAAAKKTSQKTARRKRVRLPFILAGVATLVGFGVVSGIAFDLATRPPPKPPRAMVEAHASRRAPPPRVVAPQDKGSIFDNKGTGSRAWGDDPAPSANDTQTPRGDAQTPLLAFAVPVTVAARRPVLAVVIDDMGVDHARALKAIDLPGPLTLSLMTYADDLPGLVALAHAKGHEVLAHLPMEPVSPKENPGPGALLAKMDEAAIRRQIAADLDGWSGYVGINNHMGSKFTADRTRMTIVMEELKVRGLMWLDSRTTGDSAGPDAAAKAGVPFITRDIFLDNVETIAAVTEQFEKAEAAAKTHGIAVAIGHPHDATIAALKQLLPSLEAAGVTLVPVTEILRRKHEEVHRAE